MSKNLYNDSAAYSSVILKELTYDREKNVLMLKQLRERNQKNARLTRQIDYFLLAFLRGEEREEFIGRLSYEIRESHREAITIISKALRKVIPEKDIRNSSPETLTGKFKEDSVFLIQTEKQVILKLDNPRSEFQYFLIDYFRTLPHWARLSGEKGDEALDYRWDKKNITSFGRVPDEIDYLFTFGSALMAHGLYSYAASRFQEILNRNPDDHESLLRLSDCFGSMGQEEFAFHYLRRAVSVKPDDARAYRQLADCYRELGLYRMALENLLRARELGEEDWEIHNNIGVAYAHLEDYGQSIEAYKKALEVDPNSATLLRNIGFAYRRMGQFDQAIEAYEKYSELDPENQEPHMLLGEVYEEISDFSKAAEAYQSALQIRPDYLAYMSLGEAYEKLNRIPDARASYEEALKIDPNGKPARFKVFQLDHPDMGGLEEEMAQLMNEHPFLDDLDAVPIIYEEAKRRRAEREGKNTESKQDTKRFGLN